MIAGVVLIAVALGASGHGFWWLFGLFWVLPHGGVCGGAARRRRGRPVDPTTASPAPTVPPTPQPTRQPQPDATQDRHEAFPSR